MLCVRLVVIHCRSLHHEDVLCEHTVHQCESTREGSFGIRRVLH